MFCLVLRERGRFLGLRLKTREEKLRKGKRGEKCSGATKANGFARATNVARVLRTRVASNDSLRRF